MAHYLCTKKISVFFFLTTSLAVEFIAKSVYTVLPPCHFGKRIQFLIQLHFYSLVSSTSSCKNSPAISSWKPFLEATHCNIQLFSQRHKYSGSTTRSASSASHVDYVWLFAHLYVCPLLYPYICTQRTSVPDLNGQRLPRLWCPVWCCFLQEEGEQRKSKTGHLQICQGSSPAPPFCPWGKTHQRKRSLPAFIPLFCPRSALLSLGRVLPSNTPLFPHDTDSDSNRCHLAWSQSLSVTWFPQTNFDSSSP